MQSVIATERLTVRDYTAKDRSACLALFDGNAPAFFATGERVDYAQFLQGLPCPYLVIYSPNAGVVAAGGYYVTDEPELGGLAWGLVARDWQRRGVGRELLQLRLSRLRATSARMVRVRTSQASRGFFERAGFRVVRFVPNGSAPNSDLIELLLALRAA
jgi:GNAT superfamily N-acetyltransferase